MTDEEKINNLIDWFSDKFKNSIIQGLFIEDEQNWDAINASLDIIRDLQRAKTEYFELNEINHLQSIGIMQTIYIEQDTILTFKNAILRTKDKLPSLSDYKYNRDFRNKAFGHPSAKESNKKLSRHFFDIIDKNKKAIKVINWESSGEVNSITVNLNDLVDMNSKATIKYLIEIRKEFTARMEETKKNYKVKLTDLLTYSNYTFEKLISKKNDKLVIDGFETIITDILEAKSGLIERNIYNDFEKDIEMALFLTNKLKPL